MVSSFRVHAKKVVDFGAGTRIAGCVARPKNADFGIRDWLDGEPAGY